MKKTLAWILALAMVLTMAMGTVALAEDKVITWVFWDDLNATNDLITKGYADVVKRFNEADNGYHVNVITTNLEEYDSKVAALIASKQVPDVWVCNPGPNMDVYVEAGLCMPLDEMLASDPEWADSFSGGIFERLTYDDQIMAIPTNFAAACCFYNTEMFEKAGVEVPATFEEFIAACEKLQAAGYQPITCSAGTAWCLSMVAGYLCDRAGGPDNLIAVSEGTSTWIEEESYTVAMNKLLEMSKFFQKTCASDTNDECVAQFYNEQAAILIQGSWVIGQINGSNPAFEDKCGVFQFPAIEGAADPNRMIVKTDNLLVSKTTAHPDAVKELLKYFTDDIAQKYTAEVGGKIPVTLVDIDYEKAPKQLSYVNAILENMTGTFGFYNESLASVEAGDVYDNAMVSVVLGQKTVEQALKSINDFYEDEVWE